MQCFIFAKKKAKLVVIKTACMICGLSICLGAIAYVIHIIVLYKHVKLAKLDGGQVHYLDCDVGKLQYSAESVTVVCGCAIWSHVINRVEIACENRPWLMKWKYR